MRTTTPEEDPRPDGEPPPVEADLLGVVLASRYKIEEKLGRGTTGAVYRASHVKFGRKFAVKVLHKSKSGDLKLARRFDREAELGGKVRHPNVISVVDVGETPDGTRFMVMELVTGFSLARVLVEQAPLQAPRVLHLLRDLCKGLHHAHERGVIHRDFKPENIIVELDDQNLEVPRIVDFGIAIAREEAEEPDSPDRLTTNGLVLGTPHYMAPEQATGFAIDQRIDLFALGVIAYEMLTGVLPFDGSGVEVARANILVPTPRMADRAPGVAVDPLLEAFTARLMSKDPEQRPPNANAARELLDLIERDRAAAAEALGVTLPLSELPTTPLPIVEPAVPEPMRPTPDRTERVAMRLPTEDVAPPMRRSTWPAMLVLAALIALVLVVWMITHAGSGSVVPVVVPVVPDLASGAAPIDAGIARSPPPPADAAVVIAVAPSDAGVAHVGPRPVPLVPPTQPPLVRPHPPADAGVAPPTGTPGDPSAGDVATLYAAVGREMRRAQASHSPDVTEALSIRFRRIRLADAMATLDARRTATTELEAVRRAIAELPP